MKKRTRISLALATIVCLLGIIALFSVSLPKHATPEIGLIRTGAEIFTLEIRSPPYVDMPIRANPFLPFESLFHWLDQSIRQTEMGVIVQQPEGDLPEYGLLYRNFSRDDLNHTIVSVEVDSTHLWRGKVTSWLESHHYYEASAELLEQLSNAQQQVIFRIYNDAKLIETFVVAGDTLTSFTQNMQILRDDEQRQALPMPWVIVDHHASSSPLA
jgi:hypothetical protein